MRILFYGIDSARELNDWRIDILPRFNIDIGVGLQIGWLLWGITIIFGEVFDSVDDFMDSLEN